MKKFLILVFLFILSFPFYGQNITGKIIDAENSIEITNVQIINLDATFSTSSDTDGSFSIPKSDTYIFNKNGFISRTIFITKSNFLIITLEAKPEYLEEIQIITSNFKSDLKKLSTAIAVISKQEISSNNLINYAPILNSVSGVFMQNGTLTTNRITIRGIGSRNLFGTSKIRAYYQDIPLTNGSGESTIEDIEMSSLGRIEIWKGPSSSLYGAGLGGTIQLIPRKGQFDHYSIDGNYTFGSFGLKKYGLGLNLGDIKNSAIINYSNTHSDGYRENNEMDRQVITITSNHFLNDNNKLIFIGNYIDLKAFIPSSLNEDDYHNNPEFAASSWADAKGYEDYKKALIGLSWQHSYNSKTKQYTSIFTSLLDSYEPRPFNILEEKTNAIGLRTRLLSESEVFNNLLKWTLGGEIFNDNNAYKTFENLYKDFPPGTGSVQGDILSDFKEIRTYYNLFFDLKYILTNKTTLSLGLNFNQTFYTLKDEYQKNGKDFSGNYGFDPILSPKIGLTHQFNKNLSIYATISHGFSPPTLEETLLPNGLINTDIKPETGWNFEIGSRGDFIQNKLFYDVALYRMNVNNLLVARRTSQDEFIGINAGSTQYNGLEITLNYYLVQSKKINLLFANSASFNDFKFKDFVYLENDYSGNQLTGMPKFSFNSNLHLDTNFGLYAYLNYFYVGEIPMRDDNSIYSDEYQLVNTKVGYKNSISKKIQLDVFVGINNLFNEKYASMLLINAGSFGNNAPRYYYPGEPINYYSGLNLKYNF
jgi:iron complex outermembrane receptor protein